MTSQVAVMNLRGIAVASDTILSLGSDAGTKTMGNTGKIYSLGDLHNVVVLHSGNADLNSIPAHLFISEWSRTLAAPLTSLQDYVDSFIKWAGRDNSIHSTGSELTVISAVLDEHFNWVSRNISAALGRLDPKQDREKESTYLKRKSAVVDEEIFSGLTFLKGLTSLDGMDEKAATTLLSKSNYDLDAWIESYFSEFPVSDEGKDALRKSAAISVTKFQDLGETDCSLAFVGFGAEEPFGGSIRVTCRGIYGARLQASVGARFAVSPEDSKSAISHFAQGDAIAAFLRGFTWRVYEQFASLIRVKTSLHVNETGDPVDSTALAREITEEIDSFSHENFVSPLLSTVEAMSMQSLGDFAESLVGLQATATYSQSGTATVGGLIEVATIDRINGVVWKQKLKS